MSVPDTLCPLCGADMREPRTVHVCGNCQHGLASGAHIEVRSTGEFRVSAVMEAASEYGDRGTGEPGVVRCTWCSRDQAEVRKLLSQGTAHICNECVALCSDILFAELGEDWRS